MRRLIFFFTLILVSLAMNATGQEGDIIYIDGEQWELLGKPVYADSILNRELKAALPEGRGWSTANWSGYTAYWSIQHDQLCLDSVLYTIYDSDPKKSRTERIPSGTLLRIFEKYVDGKTTGNRSSGNERIVASWLNIDIRVARGKMIYYVHDGFTRNYENEQIISLDHGKVTDRRVFQNYIVEGFSFDRSASGLSGLWPGKNMQPMSNAELREKLPLHIEQYPELADVKRISFHVKRARVDATGHLVDCEVRVLRPGDNPRLATEMAEAMKAYHPWRVSYINGEFRGYGIEGYTFTYILHE